MKYIDVDKLLAELDTERKDWLIAQNEFKDDDPELAAFYEGKAKKCAKLYYYINSLKQDQPSIPSNLDEAEFEYVQSLDEMPANQEEENMIYDAFKAGAEWMAGHEVYAYCIQSYNPVSESPDIKHHCITLEYEENENTPYIRAGDRVFIQIRKKEE